MEKVHSEWKKYKNILCVRLDNMGDVLMTTPSFRAIKETNPNCRITLLSSTWGCEIAPFIPEIDNVITFNAPWIKTNDNNITSQSLQAIIQKLKRHHFDAAIIFNVYSQSPLPAALLCFMADIPKILAYSHEKTYQLLTNYIKDPEPEEFIRHEVQRQLDLVASVGYTTTNDKLSLYISQGSSKRAFRVLIDNNVDLEKPWIIMHTGATSTKRIYPAENFSVVAKGLIRRGFQILLTGVESEQEYINHIQKNIGEESFSLAGKLSLDEFIGLVASSPLVITNNSGPSHIASAVGTPVVVLYALTNPQHTPWKNKSRVLYFDIPTLPPPSKPRTVTPEEVIIKALELLREGTFALQPDFGERIYYEKG